MGIFSKKDKVTSSNAMERADAKMKSTAAVGYQVGNDSSKFAKEDDRYGNAYMADVYVDVKNDHNATLTFQLPDRKGLDETSEFYNRGGDVLPHGIAELVGKKSMEYFNDMSATSLSFQKTGIRKGAVEEPATKSEKGGKVFNFRLTGKELGAMFTYINAKRAHSYTGGYTSATFASHALQAAGINVGIKGGSADNFTQSMKDEIEKEDVVSEWTQTAVKTVRSVGEKDESAPDGIKYMAESKSGPRKKGFALKNGANTNVGAGNWNHSGLSADGNHKVTSNGVQLSQLYTNLSDADYSTLSGKERLSNKAVADRAVVDRNLKERKAAAARVQDAADRSRAWNEIMERADKFMMLSNNFTAMSLIKYLDIHCHDDATMEANYLTNERVAPICAKALQRLVFDKDIATIPQSIRDKARTYLARFAPEKNSEEAYQRTLERTANKRKEVIARLHANMIEYRKSRSKGQFGGASDFLKELSKYIVKGHVDTTVLDMKTLKDEFGIAVQEIAFTTTISQDVRKKASELLAVFAPELNSQTSFNGNKEPDADRILKIKKSGYEAFAQELATRASIGLRCNEQALEIFDILQKDNEKYSSLLRETLGSTLLRIAHDHSVDVEKKNRELAVTWCTKLNLVGQAAAK